MYSSWLLVIYFPELYISILTVIILSSKIVHTTSMSTITSENNQSIIFPPVFSKYILSGIRIIFPIQKKRGMIRIFA